MTVAPGTLTQLQARLSSELGTTNLGIVADARHMNPPEGYHVGAKTLRALGYGGDYSLKYALDRNATDDFACAIDIGGPAELQMTLGNRMVHALQTQDPRVYGKVRAVNAPWGGVTIDRRYDLEDPTYKLDDNIQDNSDRGHIHLEVYRTLVLKQTVIDGIFDVFAGVPLLDPLEEIVALDPDSAEYKRLVNDIAEAAAEKVWHKDLVLPGTTDTLHAGRILARDYSVDKHHDAQHAQP